MANNTIKVLSEKVAVYELEKRGNGQNEHDTPGDLHAMMGGSEEIRVGGGSLAMMDGGRDSHASNRVSEGAEVREQVHRLIRDERHQQQI